MHIAKIAGAKGGGEPGPSVSLAPCALTRTFALTHCSMVVSSGKSVYSDQPTCVKVDDMACEQSQDGSWASLTATASCVP